MNKSTFLVIGGAGYIGSHLVKALIEQQHQVVIVDNLSAGSASAVLGGELIIHDFDDREFLDSLFSRTHFDGVFHFASQIVVSESVKDPGKYYRANTAATLTLLEAMRDHKVGPLVFSSTAAVYGEPLYTPIDEKHPTNPLNPYGRSKLMVEHMLADFDSAYGQKYIALRYFNAAGADPQARIGERHDPETHLIPLVLQAISGKRPPLQLFGQDYDTPDGTCIRDYIYIHDLCHAHLLALEALKKGMKGDCFNLGSGDGYSVKEIISMVEKVTGKKVPFRIGPRRSGDPARLVASAKKAKKVLGWKPQMDLKQIIQTAWKWETRLNSTKRRAS